MLPGPAVPKVNFLADIYFDKWVHAGLYFFWVLIWIAGIQKWQQKSIILIGIFMTFFGAAIEIIQHNWVAGRTAEWADWLADNAGIILGNVFVIRRKKQ